MPRFSKLKKRIEALFSPNINLEVRCTVYRKRTQYGPLKLPRLWITLNGEIVFDFIKDFANLITRDPYFSWKYKGTDLDICHLDIMFINDLIQEYIETPADILFDHVFPCDYYGLTDILKAADRRIGKNRLLLLKNNTQSEAAKKVIEIRLGIPPNITDESQKAGIEIYQ